MNLRVAAGFGPSLVFENPKRTWAPSTVQDAVAALRDAQRALDDGGWIAGAISYEFGALLAGIEARSFEPLFVLGVFDEPRRVQTLTSSGEFSLSAPLTRVEYDDYARTISHILAQIRDGEVYQVNYTIPFDLGCAGDPSALFQFLASRAQTSYGALVEYGDRAIVSISPELFLEFSGDRVSTKPMKGTAPLGRLEDLASEKNRAEHVMIVDLLRNDLTRVCEDVRVERLFEVERYPTFATMTSTISGKLRGSATTLEQILRAAFPCGSVTGAPKRAAMQHIARVERDPRGFYTGTIGFLSPQRRGWWNVPIRTLQIDCAAGSARFDAGGGIVSDSQAREEWNEILVKSRFLAPALEEFALLETFRGGPEGSDITAHLRRLERSAKAFNVPVDIDSIAQRLNTANSKTARPFVRVRARADRVEVFSEPLTETRTPVELCLSSERVRSNDPLLRHKTSWRPIHDKAAREARERDCFDAVLLNERGEVTEGARTNIFIKKGNTLYTPPLECGVLPGILRSRLVAEGRAVERVLTQADLASADAIFAGNSARGLLPARIR